MNSQKEKQEAASADQNKAANQTHSKISDQRQEDDDQQSYPGKLDQVEGRMNNGELGGNLRKEEESDD